MRRSLEELVHLYRDHRLHVVMIRELTRWLEFRERGVISAHERRREDVRQLVAELVNDGLISDGDAERYVLAAHLAERGECPAPSREYIP